MLHDDDIKNAESWNPHVKKSSSQSQSVSSINDKSKETGTATKNKPSGENVSLQVKQGDIRNSNVPHVSDIELPANIGNLEILYEQPVEKNNIRPLNTDVIEFSQPQAPLCDRPVTKKRKRRKKSRWMTVLLGLFISTISGIVVFLWLINSDKGELSAYQESVPYETDEPVESILSDVQEAYEPPMPSDDSAENEYLIDSEEYSDSPAENLAALEETDHREGNYEPGIADDDSLGVVDDTSGSFVESDYEPDFPEYENIDASPGTGSAYGENAADDTFEPDMNENMEGIIVSERAEEALESNSMIQSAEHELSENNGTAEGTNNILPEEPSLSKSESPAAPLTGNRDSLTEIHSPVESTVHKAEQDKALDRDTDTTYPAKKEAPADADSFERNESEPISSNLNRKETERAESSIKNRVENLKEELQPVTLSEPLMDEREEEEKDALQKTESIEIDKGIEQIGAEHLPDANIKPLMLTDLQAHQEGMSPTLREMYVNYEEHFSSRESRWPVFQESTASGQIEDGSYKLQNRSIEKSRIVLYPDGTPSDMDFMFRVSVISVRGFGDYSYGIIFGARDSENTYSFQIRDGHMYSVIKVLDGNTVELASGEIDNIFIGNDSQKSLKIVKKKDTVRFYVDGHFIDEVYNSDFLGDKVGFLLKGNVTLSIDSIQKQMRFKNN